MKNNQKLINSLLKATIITSVFIVLITIIGELYVVEGAKPLKDFLKGLHSHHWIGKGIWAAILFAVVTLASYKFCSKNPEGKMYLLPKITAHVLVAGSLVLIAFFMYEYNLHH